MTRHLLEICALLAVLTALVSSPLLAQNAAITLNDNGLATLSYGGYTFVTGADGALNYNCGVVVHFQKSDGTSYAGQQSPNSTRMDYATGTMTQNFDWGKLQCQYTTVSTNQVNFRFTFQNTTQDTLTDGYFYLLRLTTPNPPTYYDARVYGSLLSSLPPIGLSYDSGPGAVLFDYGGTSRMAWRNECAVDQSSGFGGGFGSSGSGILPVISFSSIPGGTSMVRTESVRFGPTSSTILDLAGDVYQRYDAAYPMNMNWPDRRMISRLFLSSTIPHPTDGKNPRGWGNNDDTIDVLNPTTGQVDPAGYPNLRTKLLAQVDYYINRMKTQNTQGVIVWDIEGQEFPHAISYVGDPDMINTLAPEMNYTDSTYTTCLADEIFKHFRDAGFKVGLCVRPQKMVYQGNNWYTQVDQDDPGQELYDDFTYAINRWGCSMFYVDSTVRPWYGGNPIPGHSLWQKVINAYPNILIMGENQDPTYYSYGAPYDQTNVDNMATPQSIIDMYQGAATAVAVYDYQSNSYNTLLSGVRRGDILLGDGWYPHSDFTAVQNLYSAAGNRPTVSITAPASNSSVMGSVTIAAIAACQGKTVSKVEFYAGPVKIGEDISSPYSFTWSGIAGGLTYNLYAKAITTDGCSAVSNPVKIVTTFPPQCVSPVITPAEGTFLQSVLIKLSCTTAGATIHYTLDGTDPTSSSPEYLGPIARVATVTIKARAFKSGFLDSDVSSAYYVVSQNWQQIGSTVTATYSTPDTISTDPVFSSTGEMPAELTISGGTIPNMRVEYTLDLYGVTNWGMQTSGHSGLALFQPSTPSPTDGLFSGVFYDGYQNRGALIGNAAVLTAPPDPGYVDPTTFSAAVEVLGGVAITTLIGFNSASYKTTTTDVGSWSGQTAFAAFHSGGGSNYQYGRAFVHDIKFYGPTPLPTVQKLSGAKSLADGAVVSITAPLVATVASATFSDGSIYVTDTDRSGGLKLTGVPTALLWDNLTVTGIMDAESTGERVLRVASVDNRTSGTALAALGMSGRSLSASGLLVRVWGKIVTKSAGSFVIDDGSGIQVTINDDGSGIQVTINVDGLASPIASLPDVDAYAGVTGPAGCGSAVTLAVKPRSSADIQVY